MTLTVIQYELIKQMARDGLGYEDISVKLGLAWRDVRPIVIRGKNDNVPAMQVDLGPLGRGTQHPVRGDRDGV